MTQSGPIKMLNKTAHIFSAATAKILIILTAGMLLTACGGKDKLKYEERDVVTLYNDAFRYLEDGQNRYAAVAFDEVERQHPYSSWARRAQLMSAYSYYLANKYEEAVLAAERFVSLHPGNENVAYAYYLMGLCYFEQISDVQRDQKSTELALASFSEVVRRFPDTDYAKDARLKIDLTYDHLAGKEMEIGRFYQNSGEYFAAINRFKTVASKYQGTSHVPEALHRLVESYLALGIVSEAKAAAALLGHNYPGSRWYKYSYKLMGDKDL